MEYGMDNKVDPVKTIYNMLLKSPGRVTDCSIEDNIVTIVIALFDDPKYMHLSWHNYHLYEFQLSPETEKSGLLYSCYMEQELPSHY